MEERVQGAGGRGLEGSAMPTEYERLRDKFIGQGMSFSGAQKKAAKIYNSRRRKGDKPVHGKGK